MRRKLFLFLLAGLLTIMTSCSQIQRPAPYITDIPKNVEPEHLVAELEVVKETLPVKESLKPPLSFLDKANYHLAENEVFYRERVVVLTYHHISKKPVSSITIKPERFDSDLKMLKDNKFNVISYRDMLDGIDGKAKFPPNAVVITFDDGYESFYNYAYPLLTKYKMPAASFVITSWTESYSKSDSELNQLSPDEIREMYKSGLIDIQSHSHNGHDYIIRNEKNDQGGLLAYRKYDTNTGSYEPEADYEKRVLEDLSTSIPIIQKYTDNAPESLCFPFGHYNSKLVELGKQAGFKYFVTTVSGSNKENSKTIYIRRIRSGDAKLSPEKLRQSIIDCGTGKPASP